jgi:hypothetical protein
MAGAVKASSELGFKHHRRSEAVSKGERRPADVIGNAVHVIRIATGEIEESFPPDDGKNKASQELGRMGGWKEEAH